MKYDPNTPVAVFLGPTLDRAAAQAILPANYYPPVRMGDVYRLLATGVRLIVVIDGVFHETTPVWQREIGAALSRGITVVGASSMGALRGAELAELGMVGCGTIFRWYRDGVLDGDDEVALLHCDETLAYRPLSEPLVNVRWNLARAVERGLLAAPCADEMIAFLKRHYFAKRSHGLLLESPAAIAMTEGARGRLERFLAEESEDLKRSDALVALELAARLLRERPPEPAPRAPTPPDAPGTPFPAIEALRRGMLRSDGELLRADAVLRAAVESGVLGSQDARACTARFYLERFARDASLRAPEDRRRGLRAEWLSRRGVGDAHDGLRRLGLTADELDEELERRATCEWLLSEDPERHGIDFAAARRGVDAFSAWLGRGVPDPKERASLLRDAVETAWLAAWARARGIACPAEVVAAFFERCEQERSVDSSGQPPATLGLGEADYRAVWSQRALYHWLLEKGPLHFGYAEFSLDCALLRELQLSGRALEVTERTLEPVA